MEEFSMKIRRLAWFAILLVFAGLFMAITVATTGRSEEEKEKPKSYMDSYTGAAAENIGSDKCLICHVKDKVVPKSPTSHIAILDSNKDCKYFGFGCEGCHGPGSMHNGDPKGILNPTRMNKDEVNTVCSKCHAEKGSFQEKTWEKSRHFISAGLGCLACHSGHSEYANFLNTAKVTDLCFTCHAQIKEAFEGGKHNGADPKIMTCVMCHNPHDIPNPDK
jgi:predicted CXXCH cytochrome family protein